MQIKRQVHLKKLKNAAAQLGIENYQTISRGKLLATLENLLQTDEIAATILKSLLPIVDAEGNSHNRYYVKKSDPNFVQNYEYESLSVGDLAYIKDLLKVTSKRCKDPFVPVYRRKDLVNFISRKLQDDNYNIKYFNGSVYLMSQVMKHRKLTISAVTQMDFLLDQKETFIIIDRILTSPTFREESEQAYYTRSQKGRTHKSGDPYLKSYITHTLTNTLETFFREIGFSKTDFFFSLYLQRCMQQEKVEYYLNLCKLWDAYMKDHLHTEHGRLEINLNAMRELYPDHLDML